MRTFITSSALALLISSSGHADTLFTEDFQDGNATGWNQSGAGGGLVTVYAGNYSLRLTHQRAATHTVSTAGYDNIAVSMQMAASSLEWGETCIGEVSADGGNSWSNVVTVYNGQDDGVTLYPGSAAPAGAADTSLILRVRAGGTNNYDYCWADNIAVTGDVMSAVPDITASGSFDFGELPQGSGSQQQVVIANAGDADLAISGISQPAHPFSLVSDDCSAQTLAPTNNCQITLAFYPTSVGTNNDALILYSNDPDQPALSLPVSGTGSQSADVYDPLTGSGSVNRSALTFASLNGSALSLTDYSAWALPANAANPTQQFEGTLTLNGESTAGNFIERGTNLAGSYTDPQHLPEFSYDFVQLGTHLIPATRGLIATSHPSWSYLFGPGRVWQENGDNGYSRAALPFSLQENGANCTHNGVMTFAFTSDGSITNLAYQIAGETCAYFKFDMWGMVDATYTPGTVTNAATLTANYQSEVAARMPTKPISALATDFPSAGINVANIGSEQTAEHRTVFGVAVNGVHYTGSCNTRRGDYPYCDALMLPSYSTAKSVVGGVGLMRLEQKYAGIQKNLMIGDYVSECTGYQWDDVTFEQALDMATGNYTSSGFEVDEGSSTVANNFFLKYTHSEKVAHSCAYPRKSTPGSLWVYHTSDTYLLGRALQIFYRNQAGTTKDFYRDLLVEELWKPLNLSPTTYTSLRTFDSTAQALAGYGLTFQRDDVVKLAEFLQLDNGYINGTPMLDSNLLNDALQRTSNRGLAAGGSNDRYQNGFWGWNAKDTLGCSSDAWVPYMSGYGGIAVVLLPNGISYYVFSDNAEYTFNNTAKELNKIESLCP